MMINKMREFWKNTNLRNVLEKDHLEKFI